MTEVYFVTDGCFGLFNKKMKTPSEPLSPFLVLPRHTVYGDYQILYDLHPTMDLRTISNFIFLENTTHKIKKEDQDCNEFVVMCLDAEKLRKICELYPETAKSIKYRSLDRRAYFLR